MVSFSDPDLMLHNIVALENYSPGESLTEKDGKIISPPPDQDGQGEGNDERVREAILQSLDWIENTFYHSNLPKDLSNRSIHQISSCEAIDRLRKNILGIQFQNPCEKFSSKMIVHNERIGKLHQTYLETEQERNRTFVENILSKVSSDCPELLSNAIDAMVAARICSDPRFSWKEGIDGLVERLKPRTPNEGSGGAFFVPALSHIAINGESEFIMRRLRSTLGIINALLKTLCSDDCPELWNRLAGLQSSLSGEIEADSNTLSHMEEQLSEILFQTKELEARGESDIQILDELYQLLSRIHFDLRPFRPLLLDELKEEEILKFDPDVQDSIKSIKEQGQQKVLKLMNKIRQVEIESTLKEEFAAVNYFDQLSSLVGEGIDESAHEAIALVLSEEQSSQNIIRKAIGDFLELEDMHTRDTRFFVNNLNEIGDPESEFTELNEEFHLLEVFGLTEKSSDEDKKALGTRLSALLWELPFELDREPLARLLTPGNDIPLAERDRIIAELPILVKGDKNNDLALDQLAKLVQMRKERNDRETLSFEQKFHDSLASLSVLGGNPEEKKDRLKKLSVVLKDISNKEIALHKRLHSLFEDLYKQKLRLLQIELRNSFNLVMENISESILDKGSREELERYVQNLISPELDPGFIDSLSRPARAITSRTKKVILDRAPLLEKLSQSVGKIRSPLDALRSLNEEDKELLESLRFLKGENPLAYVQEFAHFANEKFRNPQEKVLFQVVDQFVAKPIGLEPAMPKSRTKMKVERHHLPPGIEPGEGAIREVGAYLLQSHLGLQCGVPPTLLISSTHPFLGDRTEVMSLQKKVAFSDDAFSIGEDLKKLPDSAMDAVLLHIAMMQMDGHGHNLAISDDRQKFILIDNGLSLPRPSPSGSSNCQGLRYARYGWMAFPQAKTHLSAQTREKIAAWDIPQIVASFKESIEALESRFPEEEHCHIADECFQLLELNLRLIKVGAELNKTYREIGSVHVLSRKAGTQPPQFVGGEIIEIYRKHILGKIDVNWNAVELNFRKVFSKTNGERLSNDTAFKSRIPDLEEEMAVMSDEEGGSQHNE